MAKPRKRSPAKPRVPHIRNVADIKGPLRPGTLIHFTAEQWEQLTSGLSIGKAVPKFGAGFEAYPIPDGGFVGQPICIQGPCERCRSRITGFGPGGERFFECQCLPDLEDPLCREDPPPPPTPRCALALRLRPLRLTCRNHGCSGTCRLTAVRERWRWVIVCACR